MSKIIISDTSCLIALSKIDKLKILSDLYSQIYITNEVKLEFGRDIPDWIIVKEVNSTEFQRTLENKLDKGEASSIALAIELENTILIIDEIKGRKIAESFNIKIIGTLGVLLTAYRAGKISNLESVLQGLIDNGFRISEKIVKLILDKI